MPLNLSDDERRSRFSRARQELDSIFTEFNGKISPHIEEIIDYKAYSLLSLISEWESLYKSGIHSFNDVVDFKNTKQKLGKALAEYTKYVYNYRFCNNLTNNILFRKILSFEMYFLSKNEVLSKKMNAIESESKHSDNESLFYLNPLGHFMFFRIQKELHVRTHNLAETQETLEMYDDILTIIRLNMHEFFNNFQNGDGKIHSQNDFRDFLKRSDNRNLLSIIEYIEKNLKINI